MTRISSNLYKYFDYKFCNKKKLVILTILTYPAVPATLAILTVRVLARIDTLLANIAYPGKSGYPGLSDRPG